MKNSSAKAFFKTLALVSVFGLVGCSGMGVGFGGGSSDEEPILPPPSTTPGTVSGGVGTAQWARTVSSSIAGSGFYGVATDASGNLYAAGYIYQTGIYGFGNDQTATGTSSGYNPVIVKYDNAGVAQWAKTVSSGNSDSQFSGVATDSSGNSYVSGFITGTGSYDFGNGQTVAGTDEEENAVLVKYDSAGTAQWARTVNAGDDESRFTGVATDSMGNSYVCGFITGLGSYSFGGWTVTGASEYESVLVVKYDSAGAVQWAKTVVSAGPSGRFSGIASDGSGNIYAVGDTTSPGTHNFGSGVTLTPGSSLSGVILIVKYSSAGVPQWARSSSGTYGSYLKGVTCDAAGNAYAVGYIGYAGANFGDGLTVVGVAAQNTILIKYSSTGVVQWARTAAPSGGAITSASYFNGVARDAFDNIYAVGFILGTVDFSFGNQTAAGTSPGLNCVLVKYNSSGVAQWVSTTSSGSGTSHFYGAATDAAGNIYAAGSISYTSTFGFGNGVTATGSSFNDNPIVVQYN